VAEKLRHRLADLQAATSAADLAAGQPREIKVGGHSYIAIELCEKVRIVFCANHNAIPTHESGDVDWSQVNRIKIVAIDTNHG
jgi:proteic killer suppression protein